jgi:hypothetical protein
MFTLKEILRLESFLDVFYTKINCNLLIINIQIINLGLAYGGIYEK